MASTSLAEQLKRLQRPQTSAFTDLRKRASILFDGKEAAEKDRETIFEIGLSGLQELIQLCPDFQAFELTLFDRSSKDLARSVETSDVNRALNKQIRRFLHFLSPFFMLQPAHKCLEWLIRRYSIEAYDQDDFAMLILPYHGTRIFVRCVQILEIAGTKWDWLENVKKSGVPLAKQTLFNRLACDQALIQAVTKGTIDMVKTLDKRSYSLQTVFAFYCTSMLGCLEYAGKISESHFTNMLPGILKGLSSTVVDFTSAALMILGDLLSRISLASDTLDLLVMKLLAITHPSLQEEAMMLLVLLFQTQGNTYKVIPLAALDHLMKSKSFLATLAELSTAHYRVSPLVVPILTLCLRRVQEKTDDFLALKPFCESFLSLVVFSDVDAKEVIRCVLTSYVLKEAVEDDAVITIDSGDESDIPLSDTNLDVSLWYSNYVRSIERQYPEILSQTMKEILAVDSAILSQQRKSSLKAILGFLLTNSVQEDGNIDLFEGLFHRQSKCRVQAVRTLVSRFEEIESTSERTRDLIRSSLKERLYDDDSRVVCEVLKLPTEVLVAHVSEEELLKRAFQLLNKVITKENNSWPKAKQRFLAHLLGSAFNWQLVNGTELFIQLFPLLAPRKENEIPLFEQFVESSTMQKEWPFIQRISKRVKKEKGALKLENIQQIVQEEMKEKKMIVPLDDLLNYCEKNNEMESHLQIFFALKMIRLEGSKIDTKTGQRIVNALNKFIKDKEVTTTEEVVKNIAPASLVLQLIQDLIEALQMKGKFSNVHFEDQKSDKQPEVHLLKCLFQQIVRHMFEPATSHIIQFGEMLQKLFKKIFVDEKEVSNFLANYFAGHKLKVSPVDLESQMMAVCIAKSLMQQTETIEVSDVGVLKTLVGLHHESSVIAREVMKCVEILMDKGPAHWQKLCAVLVKNKQSILMDKEQIAFVIFNHVAGNQKGKSMDGPLKCILDVIVSPSTPDYVKAMGLLLIRHVNNPEMVKSLSNCIPEIFERKTKTGEELNYHEMMVIEEIVTRLDQSTMIVTAKNTDIWDKIIGQILDNADFLFHSSEEGLSESPFLKLLEVMDEVMFEKLPQQYQTDFLRNSLRNCCSAKNQTLFSHAVGKLIKTIPLNGKVVETLLEEMIVNPNVAMNGGTRARRTLRIEPSTDLLVNDNWRRGTVLLEMVQNKKDLSNLNVVVPALFKILKTCIDFDEQNPVEYVKQLVLASLLQCCQQLQEKMNKVDGGLKVDLVVNCIRGSVNPQTHHHALQLICHLAPFAPEVVLQNITDIFTFMGSTIVRRDDAYSFQIILKIIDSVVPILIQKSEGDSGKLVAVLKIFADIILDVPEHRRQAMYVRLFTTMDKKYLWVFVAIVLSNNVMKGKEKPKEDSKDNLPKSIRVALSILTEFEPAIVVETACHLLDYMQKIHVDVSGAGGDQQKKSVKRANNFEEALELAIFDPSKSTLKQHKHMKYALIQFISNAMAAPAFTRSVSGRQQQDEEEFKRIKPFYQEFIIKDLMCIAAFAQDPTQVQSNYWKVMLHHCYESLNNVIVLLTNQMFFAVVEGLLKHTIWTVRKKMLELLVKKFQMEDLQLTEDDQKGLVKLLGPLEQIIGTILESSENEENRTGHEMLIIQQLALIVTKLMSKLLADNYPEEVTNILRRLIGLLDHRKEIPVVVLSATVLCIADLSVHVGASAIEFLPVFMPIFLEILNTQTYNTTVDTILASMLTALQKIVETFAIFLSAYLVDILVSLALLSVKLNGMAQKEATTNATIARISQMEEKVAKYNPLRILVPAVEAAYTKLIVQPKAVDAIGPLMSVLAKSISEVTPQEIQGVQEELTNFFLEALQFRSNYGQGKGLALVEVNAIEDRIVATLISLTLKLSESTFKPLYYKIYDWAIRDGSEAEKPDRTITFYRMTSKIAEALKSLFVLFSIDFTNNSASLLDACHIGKLKDDPSALFFPEDREKCATLIEGIMSSYWNIFTYDAKKFMDANRFETLCNVFVDQLENEIVLRDAKLTETVSKAVSQMGLSIDDSLWRQLNYALLMKTKHHDHRVRLLSLRTVVEFARLIGEEYQSVLPETIPFISELMEDENAEVEKGCQKCIQELEVIVKDSLQKYL